MKLLQRFEIWGDSHHPKWVDIIRIALGCFLFYKGIDVLRHMSVTTGLMSNTPMRFNSFFLIIVGHLIVMAHLFGGITLILGIHTRLACLTQIPILIGAVILIGYSRDTVPAYELIISIVVLLLLIFFLILGNGPWSFDKLNVEEDKETRT